MGIPAIRLALVAVLLAGCGAIDSTRKPETRPLTLEEGRAMVARKLPARLEDRGGWAADVYAAFLTLKVAPTPQNVCAVVAITEQETGFKVDPQVPNLSRIAWEEIERQRERAGIPKLVLQAALALPSSDGQSYAARLDAARTEHELSDVYEDFIDRVPLGRRFLEDRNPVRTAGPMQVSVAFAKAHAAQKPYPYPGAGSIRNEVFTRRGGLYFGIAHLLDYPASYDAPLYRFADFNAGHYASRNAAFQKAVSQLTGVALQLDGDLLRYADGRPTEEPGSTEAAVRTLARELRMDAGDIRSDLEREKTQRFEKTRLYERVFALAEQRLGRAAPRAVVPDIPLRSAKFTRKLTTAWFATRVDERYRACLART